MIINGKIGDFNRKEILQLNIAWTILIIPIVLALSFIWLLIFPFFQSSLVLSILEPPLFLFAIGMAMFLQYFWFIETGFNRGIIWK